MNIWKSYDANVANAAEKDVNFRDLNEFILNEFNLVI